MPDLIRSGKFPHLAPNIDQQIISANTISIKYDSIGDRKRIHYDIMTIGDSFSDLYGISYNNYLAKDYSVFKFNGYFLEYNPMQNLISLTNGDFFDSVHVKTVILQSVERYFVEKNLNLRWGSSVSMRELDSLEFLHQNENLPSRFNYKFFSKSTLTFPLYNCPKYFLSSNFLVDSICFSYKIIRNDLFRNQFDKLLFYEHDVSFLKYNNNRNNVAHLNLQLNQIHAKLKKRGIELIVLIAPDKYDFYYDFIEDKDGLEIPLFFEYMKEMKKEYTFVDGKAILSPYLDTKKDLYFYGDTHWSPISAKIIARNINLLVGK